MAAEQNAVFKMKESRLLKQKNNFVIWGGCFSLLFFMGCQTVSPPNSQDQKKAENLQEVQSALGVVAGAVAGKELSPEELKKLGQQIQSDPAV